MRFAKSLFFVSAIASSFALGGTLDFTKINQNINESLTSVVKDSDLFSKFNYEFDAKRTQIDEDRYGFNIDAVLKQAPWSKDEVPMTGSLDLARRKDGKRGIALNLSTSATSDAVPFMKYMTSKHHCPTPRAIQGVLRILKEEDCRVAQSMKIAKSMDDLYDIMKKHIAETEASVADYVVSLEGSLQSVSQGYVKTLLSEQLELAKNIHQDLKATQVTRVGEGFSITAPSFRFGDFLEMKNFVLDVNPGEVKLSVAMETSIGSLLYEASKPEILRFMSDLEAGKEYTKELIKMDTRVWFNLIKKMLKSSR